MKHTPLLGLILACVLAACSQQVNDLRNISLTPADDARTACRNNHPAVKGNFVALATCLNAVDDKYVKPDNPDADLLNKLEVTRLALANDVDIGQITPADYQEQLQQIENQISQEEKRRSILRTRSTWGISHGLDPATKPGANPLPVIPPG